MAFDAGAIVGHLRLDKSGWDASIKKIKKDAKKWKIGQTVKRIEVSYEHPADLQYRYQNWVFFISSSWIFKFYSFSP